MSEVRDIFVDTVAWIALTNADDALHERAQQVILSNHVAVFASRRVGRIAANRNRSCRYGLQLSLQLRLFGYNYNFCNT